MSGHTSTAVPSRIKIYYGSENLGLEDDELAADQELEDEAIRTELLAKIRRCYGRVKMHQRVFDAGFCFGLLDPVSNIVAGTVISKSILHKEGEEEAPIISFRGRARDMNQRSLDGLVAFLVALFPSLTDLRAAWYLNMANLDPLVAARLVINHRRMERTFGFASDTTVAAVETALRCAAAAARHPNPHQFAQGWKLLSHSLHKVPSATSKLVHVIPLLLEQQPPPPVVFNLEESWELASRRLLKLNISLGETNRPHSTMRRMLELASCRLLKLNPPREIPPVPRPTIKRMLLTTIHGYYLEALTWMPKPWLRSHKYHYHHSLLQAGHCYGQLDPVANILANTLWYSIEYPLTLKKEVIEMEAISTRALLRIAVRSLYGLVSFLCTRYPALTPDEAMCRLHLAGADLQKVALNHTAGNVDDDSAIIVSLEEAYLAAARAARHPKPHQQAEFQGRPRKPMSSSIWRTEDGVPKSSVCSSSKPVEETKNINVLGPRAYSPAATGMIDEFWNQQSRTVRMVKSAMDIYSQQPEVPKYELHFICSVNESVDGIAHASPSEGCTHRCSHINFLATPQTAGARQQLFFAECRNDGSGVALCCPVPMPLPGTEQARCLYCECTGSMIVHPAKESFRGRAREFEKMLCGGGVYSQGHTNDGIISRSHNETLCVDSILAEDLIYGDYSFDNQLVEDLPRTDFIH